LTDYGNSNITVARHILLRRLLLSCDSIHVSETYIASQKPPGLGTTSSRSGTPISRTDEHGDTYQSRRLDDGSRHEVLKNFPAEPELRAAVEGLAADVRVEFLRYYWILSYVILVA
jgi:hypothetical protein